MSAKQQALALRSEGLTYREIATRLGIHPRTIARYCDPETARRDRERNLARNEYKREHERNHRAPCPSCGAPMGAGSGSPSKAPGLCRKCRRERDRQRIEERGHQIEALWNEGLSRRDIADRFGWTLDYLSVEVHRLREAGFNLPYRYKLSRPRHPRQVAA